MKMRDYSKQQIHIEVKKGQAIFAALFVILFLVLPIVGHQYYLHKDEFGPQETYTRKALAQSQNDDEEDSGRVAGQTIERTSTSASSAKVEIPFLNYTLTAPNSSRNFLLILGGGTALISLALFGSIFFDFSKR